MANSLLNAVKQEVKILIGRTSRVKIEADCRHEWYGDTFSGFYVNPDKLNKDSIVYSFGLGEDISFDKEMIRRHQCQVFGFDPTPKSIAWLKTQDVPSNFKNFEFGLDAKTGFVDFRLPKNKDHVSASVVNHSRVNDLDTVTVAMKSLTDIVKELGHDHIDVLKMDIEGSEYSVIDSVLNTPVKIDQILLERHERFFPDGKARNDKMVNSLKSKGYAVFAISPSMEELSFIKIKN